MRVSVIFSTYESPESLEKVLWGFAAQTRIPEEVLIADDGSGPRTAEVIEDCSGKTGLNLKHVWQPHNGFGKCRILNKATALASGDYLVYTDGDCFPQRSFVETHCALAEPKRFLSGTCLMLPMDVSRMITIDDILSGRATDPSWLRARGVGWSRKLAKLRWAKGALAAVCDAFTLTSPNWNGGWASTWKEHVISANGFDERMVHGGLDREFGERLEHAGIRGKQVRSRAISFHLEHARGYAFPEGKARNWQLIRDNRRNRVTRTPYGIVKTPEAEQELASILAAQSV